MHVLIINRFFWPDESSTAMLAADLAEDLINAGHQVTVYCARTSYDASIAPLPSRETWKGVEIQRLPSTRLGRHTPLRRLIDLASFHASLFLLGPWKAKPDVILVMTDPPMVIVPAAWIHVLRGGKLVHHVMDVYPEVAASLGAVHETSPAFRVLAAIYRAMLRRCDHVIALGDTMADRLVAKGADRGRISVAVPWADGARLHPVERTQNPFRRELGVSENDLLVMYSGNMGRAHCFDTILNGIRELAGTPGIHFVFIGDGARRDEIEQAARAQASTRIRLLPYVPQERLDETLSAADIHLISQDPRSLGLIVPSKLAGVLAVGRPVIFVGDSRSEVAQCLIENDCGVPVPDGDHPQFAKAVVSFKNGPEKRVQMGLNARQVFESHYDRKIVTAQIIRLLERTNVARASRP